MTSLGRMRQFLQIFAGLGLALVLWIALYGQRHARQEERAAYRLADAIALGIQEQLDEDRTLLRSTPPSAWEERLPVGRFWFSPGDAKDLAACRRQSRETKQADLKLGLAVGDTGSVLDFAAVCEDGQQVGLHARRAVARVVPWELAEGYFDRVVLLDARTRRLIGQSAPGTGAATGEPLRCFSDRGSAERAAATRTGEAETESGDAAPSAGSPERRGAPPGEPPSRWSWPLFDPLFGAVPRLCVGDIDYLAFRAPLAVATGSEQQSPEPLRLELIGLIERSNLQSHALVLSSGWLISISWLALIGLLSIPCFKLSLLARHERLRAADLRWLASSAFIGSAFTALAILAGAHHRTLRDHFDHQLVKLADEIRQRTRAELEQVRVQLCDAPDLLAPLRCANEENDAGCNRGLALVRLAQRPLAYPGFQSLFRTDALGRQIAKLTAETAPTSLTNVSDRSYFQAALHARSAAARCPEVELSFGVVSGKTTGLDLALFALPTQNGRIALPHSDGDPEPDGTVALSTQLRSLAATVLPYPFHYVVLDHSGEVLFRSDQKRRDLRDLMSWDIAQLTRTALATGSPIEEWRYGGRRQRTQSFTFRDSSAAPLPWLADPVLVVYYDTQLLQAASIDLFTLGALISAGLFGIAVLAIALARRGTRRSGRPSPALGWSSSVHHPPAHYAAACAAALLAGAALWSAHAAAPLRLQVFAVAATCLLLTLGLARADARPLLGRLLGFLPVQPNGGAPFYALSAVLMLAVFAVLPTWLLFADIRRSIDVGVLTRASEADRLATEQRRSALESSYHLVRAEGNEERYADRIAAWNGEHPRCGEKLWRSGAGASAQPKSPLDFLCGFQRDILVADRDAYLRLVGAADCPPGASLPGKAARAPRPCESQQPPSADGDPAGGTPCCSGGPLLAALRWLPPVSPLTAELREATAQAEGKTQRLPFDPDRIDGIAALQGAAMLILGLWLAHSVAGRILRFELLEASVLDRSAEVRRWQAAGTGSWLLLRPPQAVIEGLRAAADTLEFDLFGAHPAQVLGAKPEESPEGRRADSLLALGVDAALSTERGRAALLEWLETSPPVPVPRFAVTAIDPLYYLGSRRPPLPDVDLGRWSRALIGWEKARFALPPAPGPAGRGRRPAGAPASELRLQVQEECRWSDPLRDIEARLLTDAHLARLSWTDALDFILDAAEPHYRTQWSLCSSDEKLLMIQLAQEGVVHPKDSDTLRRLQRRQLIRTAPFIQLMNESFRRFVLQAESPDTIAHWELPRSGWSWTRVRRPLLGVLTVLGTIAFLTVYSGVDTLSTFVATATGLATAVGTLLARARDVVALSSTARSRENSGPA